MSFPRIPGYFGSPEARSLALLWPKPVGNYPAEFWPAARLRRITHEPTGWITVEEEQPPSESGHGGAHSILATPDAVPGLLESTGWTDALDIGDVSIWDDGYSDGLTHTPDRGPGGLAFFSRVKSNHGLHLPTLYLTHPFLWYWDAFPTDAGWSYLNDAGREAELVRATIDMDSWKVEVAALELRTFLAQAGKVLVVQEDYIVSSDQPKFERADAEHRSTWAAYDWHAISKPVGGIKPFARLLGKHVITGQITARVPRFAALLAERRSYPAFIYSVDEQTGDLLTHSSDPDELGTYFDGDDERLHYLTPVYFAREVLGRYAAEPKRYRVSAHRVECLDLWGIEISTNSAGLIQVYLGDLGAKVPLSELPHWQAHNVPPEGVMEEGRVRRDFLGQWASSPDPVGDLRRARGGLADAITTLLGSPVWRELDGQTGQEFASLIGPTNSDPSSLQSPVLVLTKALSDSVDPAPLKSYLGGAHKGEQSLALLSRFTKELGDTEESAEAFHALQGLRSAGGVAHLPGSKTEAALARLGISGMAPWPAFLHIVGRLTSAMVHIQSLALAVANEPASDQEEEA